jgi:hypothetical protein
MQTRLAEVGTADPASRCVPITWTTGAAVKRMDWDTGQPWIEELSCDPAHVRMGRMQSGAPLLNTHQRGDLGGVLGVVENAKVDGQKGTATVRFSRRADVEPIFQDVKDKIIRNVSVGYTVYRYDDVSTPEDAKNRVTRLRATDWEPSEVSLVPVGADANAGVRAAAQSPKTTTCVIGERSEPARVASQPATAKEMHRLRLKLQTLAEGEL